MSSSSINSFSGEEMGDGRRGRSPVASEESGGEGLETQSSSTGSISPLSMEVASWSNTSNGGALVPVGLSGESTSKIKSDLDSERREEDLGEPSRQGGRVVKAMDC